MAGHLTPQLAEKERRAVALRVAGKDYEAIAAEVGYADKGGAYKAVQRALKRSVAESADELRKIEDRRLDALLAGVWPTATTGVYDAVDRALKISKRRSELLGLDAPVKTALTDPTGEYEFGQLSDAQLEREIAVAVARVRGEAGTPGTGAEVPLDAAREAAPTPAGG